MKGILKKIIISAIKNDTVWKFINKTFLSVAYFTKIERDKFEREFNKKPIDKITLQEIQNNFPDLIVKNGIFSGMKYPEIESVGSVLFPKLLGSYEKELHFILERICRTKYTEIVDIGCAEGFYAVGLAMKIPGAKVYAYDTNKQAINLCLKMAELNGVESRLIVGDFCDSETLLKIPFTKKSLIISDCEGYEKELFSKDVAVFLRSHDLLIEIHDFMDISISQNIKNAFEETHRIQVIESIDDLKKAKTYNYRQLSNYDLEKRFYLLAEHRPHIMEWFFIQSKQPH